MSLAQARLIFAFALFSTVFSFSGCGTVPETSLPSAPTSEQKADSKIDRAPVVKSPPATPIYPQALLKDGFSANVFVDFIVDTHGDVRRAFAASSTDSRFEAAAVEAVSKWHFIPGSKGGKDVNTHMLVPVYFQADSGRPIVGLTPKDPPAAKEFIVDEKGQARTIEAVLAAPAH